MTPCSGFSGPVWRALGACMTGRPPSDLTLSDFTAKADAKAKSGEIDPLENIGRQKIYLFHGTNDTIVARASTDAAADFYRHYLGDAGRQSVLSNRRWRRPFAGRPAAAQGDGLNDCEANESPYIDRCDHYDQAGIILQHIYGALNPRNPGQLRGKLTSFDQSIYTRPKNPSRTEPWRYRLRLRSRRMRARRALPRPHRAARLRAGRRRGRRRPALCRGHRLQCVGRHQPSHRALSANAIQSLQSAGLLGLVELRRSLR